MDEENSGITGTLDRRELGHRMIKLKFHSQNVSSNEAVSSVQGEEQPSHRFSKVKQAYKHSSKVSSFNGQLYGREENTKRENKHTN